MIITYRNPQDHQDFIDVHFDITNNDFCNRWKTQLKDLLVQNWLAIPERVGTTYPLGPSSRMGTAPRSTWQR